MRYTPCDWLAPLVTRFDNAWLVAWLDELGIESFIGSSGRVFPTQMKASTFIRAWLGRLNARGVKFHFRTRCEDLGADLATVRLRNLKTDETTILAYDAVILACGGGSYAKLGGTGTWQGWFDPKLLTPLFASNVGVMCAWAHESGGPLSAHFGSALKGVLVHVGVASAQGDVIISDYGLEGSVIYGLNPALRQALAKGRAQMVIDLLPHRRLDDIYQALIKPKQSMSTKLNRLLPPAKLALLKRHTDKTTWQDPSRLSQAIKGLVIAYDALRPMAEAISTGGGIRRAALSDTLQVKDRPWLFCAGEMLDWDAPTGGYLLTACFATGRVAGLAALDYLQYAKVLPNKEAE